MVLLLAVPPGCTGTGDPVAQPGDPKAVALLESHAAALFRRDWSAAYASLHPEVKSVLSQKHFSDIHAKRRKAGRFPTSILITGSERSGDDVIVSFDVLYSAADGGAPVAVPPRHKVCVRRSGVDWALLTHDVLAAGQ
jgi:hypothetical protein